MRIEIADLALFMGGVGLVIIGIVMREEFPAIIGFILLVILCVRRGKAPL